MSIEENKQVVLDYYDALNNRDFDALDELVAEDFAGHMREPVPDSKPVRGRQHLKENLQNWIAAFPDFKHGWELIIAEGDLVVLRETYRLTHSQNFLGAAPTGKSIEISSHDIFRVTDGKIAECWNEWNMLQVFQAVGLVAPIEF